MNKEQPKKGTCHECGVEGTIDEGLHKDEIFDHAFTEEFDTKILCDDCESFLEISWCSKCSRAFSEASETKFIHPKPTEDHHEHQLCRRCWEKTCLEKGQPLYTIKPKNLKWSWYSDEELKGWTLHSQHTVPDRVEELAAEAKKMRPTHLVLVRMFSMSCLGDEGNTGLYVKRKHEKTTKILPDGECKKECEDCPEYEKCISPDQNETEGQER